MQQRHWKAHSHSASQKNTFFWNPNILYHVHRSSRLETVLSQNNIVHILSQYFSKICLRLDPPTGIFPSGFRTKILYAFLVSLILFHGTHEISRLEALGYLCGLHFFPD
jgi:hypothetical protein